MRPNPALLRCFLDARYYVRLAALEHEIRLGEMQHRLNALLDAPDRVWVLLSAGCPRSAPWPPRLNTLRLRQLQTLARRGCHRVYEAEGRASDRSWSEASLLLCLPDLRQADALACRFGQHALVWGAPAQPAALRFYGAGWRALVTAP